MKQIRMRPLARKIFRALWGESALEKHRLQREQSQFLIQRKTMGRGAFDVNLLKCLVLPVRCKLDLPGQYFSMPWLDLSC